MTIEELSEEKKKLDAAITRAIMESPLNTNKNVEIENILLSYSESFSPGKAYIISNATVDLKIK